MKLYTKESTPFNPTWYWSLNSSRISHRSSQHPGPGPTWFWMPLNHRLEGSLEASSFIFHRDVASHLPHALLSSDYFAIFVFLWPPWPHCESRFFVFTSFVSPSPRQDLTQHGGSASVGCILPCFSVALEFPLLLSSCCPGSLSPSRSNAGLMENQAPWLCCLKKDLGQVSGLHI